jgi:8-oxo-dGTP pyrophosphatase MutT (NUDIX family)
LKEKESGQFPEDSWKEMKRVEETALRELKEETGIAKALEADSECYSQFVADNLF